MRTLLCLALAALLILPANALSHGLFWKVGPAGWVLMEGHAAGHDHGGDPAVPATGLAVQAQFALAGTGAAWQAVAACDPATIPAGATAAFAVVDWGWWTRTANGTQPGRPDGVAGVLQAWSSRETVKHLEPGYAGFAQPVGSGLEVTPIADPFAVKPGGKLTVRVTLDGAPVAGAAVTYDGKVRGESGPDGTVRLKLREPGLQVIRATLRRAAADPSWAEDVQTGTVTFVLEAR